jgi:hypothetical protein
MREGNPYNKKICIYPVSYGGSHEKVAKVVRCILTDYMILCLL